MPCSRGRLAVIVCVGGDQDYRDRWEETFGKKTKVYKTWDEIKNKTISDPRQNDCDTKSHLTQEVDVKKPDTEYRFTRSEIAQPGHCGACHADNGRCTDHCTATVPATEDPVTLPEGPLPDSPD